MQQFLSEFIGHFHPVIVHLPIGILLLAAILYWLSLKKRYSAIRPAVRISLLLGMLSAFAATISGYLLSTIDDYDQGMISRHQWFGIVTTIISAIAYYLENKNQKQFQWIILLLVIMITLTGHFGGSLTHGEDYLTSAFGNYSSEQKIKPIANVQEAMVYEDIIQPILANKCYSCHSSRKQKGGLRLDDIEWILKGGKNGKVVKPGDAGESEIIHRTQLPREHEDHMPPKEKTQPSKMQIQLLKWSRSLSNRVR
jgi:uncharacterized membrane protein